MLSGDQLKVYEERDVQLLELKKALINSIEAYIAKCDSKPAPFKISLFNDAGQFRLHCKNGEAGKKRAEKYIEKIESFSTILELTETVLEDMQNAVKTLNVGLIDKTTALLNDGYSYVMSNLTGNDYYEANAEEGLGSSEVLTGLLASTFCNFLKLSIFDKEVHNTLKSADEETARLYIVKVMGRQLSAIRRWLEEAQSQQNVKRLGQP